MWGTAALLFALAMQVNFDAQGLKALDEKRYPDAVDAFTKAVAADPKDYTAHFNLAFAYSHLDKDPEAIAEYRKALELKPNLYQADLNLGILLLRQKQAAQALPLLEAAVTQKPNDARANLYF